MCVDSECVDKIGCCCVQIMGGGMRKCFVRYRLFEEDGVVCRI